MKHKAANYLVALIIILMLNFILPRIIPGDPLTAIYGDDTMLSMSPQVKDQLIKRYQLDQPLHTQFVAYIKGLLSGDLGESYYHRSPVLRILLEHLPWTLFLMGGALLIATIAGTLTGFEAAWRRGKITDRLLLATNITLFGFPNFFIGATLLVLLAMKGGLFPLQGATTAYSQLTGIPWFLDILKHAALPMLTLTLVFLPGHFLLARSSMITVLKEPFVLTAKAKGLTTRRVKYAHAGRNALIPIVTATGVQLATRIITGALFVEIVFAYPGMGLLVFQAVQNRDYPVIQGTLLLITILVLSINFLVDLTYAKLDPRQAHAR